MRWKYLSLGLLLLCGGLLCVPMAYPEGEMDGAYFKVQYESAGVNFNQGGIIGDGHSNGDCYTKLFFNGVNHFYTGGIVCEVAPGEWELTGGIFGLSSLGDGTAVGNDDFIRFTNAQGHVVAGYSTSKWIPKLDDSKVLKSAKGKVLGSEACCGSTLDNGKSIYIGKLTVTTRTVAADRVPQDARNLLDNF